MKASIVTGPGTAEVIDIPRPQIGPADVLVKMRACGVCGSDGFYISIGGLPPRQGHTPLGHEPAGEIVEVGAEVTGIAVGDHVVINPMAQPANIIGNGGDSGALADYLLIENAVRGVSLEVIPDHVPWEVAALNEPMAVARHAANRCRPKPGDTVVVFGAGPIGLGAVLAFKSLGVGHIVVADLIPARLAKARQIGADAVINSAEDDVIAKLIELHGPGEAMFPGKAGTDIYLDAAGAPAVIDTALTAAKKGATLGVVAVHKKPVPIEFVNVMSNEITILGSIGYPDEIFDVTSDLVANWETYRLIVSHTIPFGDVGEALRLASDAGAADKVVVTFGEDD
ncbi:threonine dehydrogenase-like Zn-dependent dehydrogenase [Mycolicibacterium sp. BK556]|uniref:zinc-dependent alcohol dehydrogenase n=1 Tax=unclassified Mycolicibacterium TaxID=2636767 RepID=UPI001619043D|nr:MULTISPECIES: zinc-binding dehydrogenase [unclassified Mycolicibacterium]MBB3603635.1 threonine dehydrogenase-like Zn-dependent dehydrogenase [Mycolicibacterium sp. BK556]MBB3633830.1 threonine dehydrogenase-like Zn-dependent dehydrogenase [Mycolicibacterium sp. BK607]